MPAVLQDTPLEEKTCTKCGESKTLGDFFFYPGKSQVRKASCKECNRASVRAYREAHRDEARKRSSDHYLKNHEQRLEWQRNYDQKNKESRREALKNARRRKYLKLKASGQHLDDWNKRYAKKHEVFDEHVDRITVFQRDEGICGICGKEVAVANFHVDHVIPLSKGGRHNYDNVQIAHASCNLMKGDRLHFVTNNEEKI